MKKLIIISLAGILAASLPQGYVDAAGTTFDQCTGQFCMVQIDVVDVQGTATIVANPEILLVAHRGNDQSRLPVTILFMLNTAGYSFVQDGITMTNPSGQFTRNNVSSTTTIVVMRDENSDMPKFHWHSYNIAVEDQDGNALNVDPVVINGGGIGN